MQCNSKGSSHGVDVPKTLVKIRCYDNTSWFDSECAAAERHAWASKHGYRRTGTSDQRDRITQVHEHHSLYNMKQSAYWEKEVSKTLGGSQGLWKCMQKILHYPSIKAQPDTSKYHG